MEKANGKWITWHGQHIFVPEGSSVINEIGNRIRRYRNKKNLDKKEYLNDLDKRIAAKEREASNYFTESGLDKDINKVNEELFEKGMRADEERRDLMHHKKAVERNSKRNLSNWYSLPVKSYDADGNKLSLKEQRDYLKDVINKSNIPEEKKYYSYLLRETYKRNGIKTLKGVDKIKINGYGKSNQMKSADNLYDKEIKQIDRATRGAIKRRADGISANNKGKRTDIAHQEWMKADKQKAIAEIKRNRAYTYNRKK